MDPAASDLCGARGSTNPKSPTYTIAWTAAYQFLQLFLLTDSQTATDLQKALHDCYALDAHWARLQVCTKNMYIVQPVVSCAQHLH